METSSGGGILFSLCDQQPLPAVLAVLEADQSKEAAQALPLEAKEEVAAGKTFGHRHQGLKGAAIPDPHLPGAVLSRRNDAAEVAVRQAMVFDLDCQPFVGRVHRWTLGDGPGLEDAAFFEAKVPVEAGGVMFVDDEAGHDLLDQFDMQPFAEGLGSAAESLQGDGEILRIKEAVNGGATGVHLLGEGAFAQVILFHGLQKLEGEDALGSGDLHLGEDSLLGQKVVEIAADMGILGGHSFFILSLARSRSDLGVLRTQTLQPVPHRFAPAILTKESDRDGVSTRGQTHDHCTKIGAQVKRVFLCVNAEKACQWAISPPLDIITSRTLQPGQWTPVYKQA